MSTMKYTETHEWVRIEGNTAVVGITDFAQSELGDVVFIDFPEIGASVEQGEEFGEIESNKAVSELKSPVSGSVTAINEALVDFDGDEHPVNVAPYTAGWLIKVELSDEAELDSLMDEAQYKAFLG